MAGLCCFAAAAATQAAKFRKFRRGFLQELKDRNKGAWGLLLHAPHQKALPFWSHLPPPSDISGGAAAALRADTITRGCGDPREAEGGGTEGGGCAAGYVVIWAVISTAVRCGAGGGDERSER
jgi:hypothetical protein